MGVLCDHAIKELIDNGLIDFNRSEIDDEQPDVLLIVSAMVRQALPDRKDLASPGDLVRDENGAVIGCGNLIIN